MSPIKEKGILPYSLAMSVNHSQSGTPVGKPRRFPMSGYPLGPGGYGRVLFDRLRNQYHVERTTNVEEMGNTEFVSFRMIV